MATGLSILGSDYIQYLNLEDNKSIRILKEDWTISNLINQAGVGFKKGIKLSKILAFLSIYFLYDR
tara:strand:+ start:223 stop:420 length:198 start_codon:yes stop_codon:yes gene_type:complete